ncbi:MAG: hypothetical protein ABIH23_08075, partial [bacterium]
STCFGFFPFPKCENFLDRVSEISDKYQPERIRAMDELNIGLSDLYKRFHNHKENNTIIHSLRCFHIETDKAVAAAYGWDDLELGHGFYETKQGVRFTITEQARDEVLRRLLELNHYQYEEEVLQGLHQNKSGENSSHPAKIQKTQKQSDTLSLLKITHGNLRNSENSHSQMVLHFLKTNKDWFGKDEILAGSGIAASRWQATIDHLLENGEVIRYEERRGTQYRAVKHEDHQE